MLIRGADMSAMQGLPKASDVAALVEQEIQYAYLRCAVGNEKGLDATMLAWRKALSDAGIACGPYFFVFPLQKLTPRDQARYHLDLAAGFGTNLGELPPAVDGEWPPRETTRADKSLEQTWLKWGCSAPQIRDWLAAYLDEIYVGIGTRPAFYTYRYWAACVGLEKIAGIGNHQLWLADYFAKGRVPTDAECAALKLVPGWDTISMIQHDGDGGLKLASGVDCDFNVMLGGRAALDAMTGAERSVATLPENQVIFQATSGMILDSEIATYRQDRIDVQTA